MGKNQGDPKKALGLFPGGGAFFRQHWDRIHRKENFEYQQHAGYVILLVINNQIAWNWYDIRVLSDYSAQIVDQEWIRYQQ